MICTKHEWKFVKEVSKWPSKRAEEHYKELMETAHRKVQELEDFNKSKPWWRSERMFIIDPRLFASTFKVVMKDGKRYQCINCDEVKDLYGEELEK